MGRKSLAEIIHERVKEGHEEERGTWLVLYDFKRMKASTKFWKNVNRVENLVNGGSMIQYSVFRTNSKRGAMTVLRLAKHYGAEAVMYRAEMMDIE